MIEGHKICVSVGVCLLLPIGLASDMGSKRSSVQFQGEIFNLGWGGKRKILTNLWLNARFTRYIWKLGDDLICLGYKTEMVLYESHTWLIFSFPSRPLVKGINQNQNF